MVKVRKEPKPASQQCASKSSLSEVYAAMTGVICAGIKVVNETDHDLARLGYAAASASYDMKQIILSGRGGAETYEKGVRLGVAFLESSLPILERYPQAILAKAPRGKVNSVRVTQELGGTVSQLVVHVHNILAREAVEGERPFEAVNPTEPIKQFDTAYLPAAGKKTRSYTYEVPPAKVGRKAKGESGATSAGTSPASDDMSQMSKDLRQLLFA